MIIRKIVVLCAWSLVIIGLATLLVAANREQKEHVCREVLIGISGGGERFYLEKEEILDQIERATRGSLINRSLAIIDLGKLEKVLERKAWIRNAELYFDGNDALHVSVEEREPIARVFTTEGNSFYIDSSGYKMPLLEKISARVPVVTGFSNARKLNARDRDLLIAVKQIAWFIYNNEFWNAQIGQIDITAERRFELIPVIGDHIIKLGNAEKIDEKLNRLYIFYKQVMGKVGFNKYAALDVQFDGQVVAINKGTPSVVDSIQLQKNIEELMKRASFQNVDEEMLPDQNINPLTKVDSTVSKTQVQTNSVPVKTNPNPKLDQASSGLLKPATQSKPIDKPKRQVKSIGKSKAVLRRA